MRCSRPCTPPVRLFSGSSRTKNKGEDFITSGLICPGCSDRSPHKGWFVHGTYPDHAPLRETHKHLVRQPGHGVRTIPSRRVRSSGSACTHQALRLRRSASWSSRGSPREAAFGALKGSPRLPGVVAAA
eukprot:scaffold29086_cov101-Isochrysis_galbana.AAC.1